MKLMTVKFEIKGMLAKLLATEDIVVEHKKVSTACFNVHTRVLTLPMWEKASDDIYTMLVLHEISHALWTPNEDWRSVVNIPKDFVNIVEDARVEKLCKRKYPGSPKSFFKGYKQLNDDDFFSIKEDDITEYNLADRANLYFKIGNFVSFNFIPEEKVIVDKINSAETFNDTLKAAEELYKYCKKESQNIVSNTSIVIEIEEDLVSIGGQRIENDGSFMDDSQGDSPNDTQSSDSKVDDAIQCESAGGNEVNDEISSEDKSKDDDPESEPEVKTVSSLEESIRELMNDFCSESVYIEVPKVNLDTVIASNSEVHAEIESMFNIQRKKYASDDIFSLHDSEYKKFKISAQKEVNYLVKEFECRKAADSYSRSLVSTTGVLDTSRLHSYKFVDDIFKKITVIPDGKNHGLVFILDWSGSMQTVLLDTCKQLFNLIWFCKKVSIPFEVYAFTCEWRKCDYDYSSGRYIAADRKAHYEKKENLFHVDECFSLMNFLTSNCSSKQLENQMMNIWRMVYALSKRFITSYGSPHSRLTLSSTPLNESIIALHQIIPQFKNKYKAQKVQCIVLTDGEANKIPYDVEIKRKDDSPSYMGIRAINSNRCFLRDRKTGSIYKINSDGYEFTDLLLTNLKDNFPYLNLIGIRILGSGHCQSFITKYHGLGDKEYNKIQEDLKKIKSFMITKSGYNAYFGMVSSYLSQNSEFNVSENASKVQIKSAFIKSLKTKKLNKKILGEFISLIV